MASWKIRPTGPMKSQVQEAAAEGKQFKLMVTFKEEGDEWCLVEIEGVKCPGYEDAGGDKPKQKKDMIGSFADARGGAGGPINAADGEGGAY